MDNPDKVFGVVGIDNGQDSFDQRFTRSGKCKEGDTTTKSVRKYVLENDFFFRHCHLIDKPLCSYC